jgi:tRNA pseudouridine32 synthase / 23S rRNA pseudouridine746 synthase
MMLTLGYCHYTLMCKLNHSTFHIPPPCHELVRYLYSDGHILAVEKPAGLLTVPGRIVKDCVLSRVLEDFPTARIVHRLDLDTSGLVILSLSKPSVSAMNRLFRERVIKKTYTALVNGLVTEDTGSIDFPLAADPIDRPKQRLDRVSGKAALTRFEVIERCNSETRLSLQPVTGRQHQLRLHLALLGHPILGCDLYADETTYAKADRLMLHSTKMMFPHPVTQESLSLESDVPF